MININQIIANLDIVTACVHNIKMTCNMQKIPETCKKEFSMDIKCSRIKLEGDVKVGKLLMQLDISMTPSGEDMVSDTFEIVIEGIFKSPAEISDAEFLKLLNINGGAALYSIARSKIETISSLTYSEGKIMLPMINMVQYYNDRLESKQNIKDVSDEV